MIYQCLKYRKSICKSKRHDQVLKVSERCIKNCFPFITLLNEDQMLHGGVQKWS